MKLMVQKWIQTIRLKKKNYKGDTETDAKDGYKYQQ